MKIIEKLLLNKKKWLPAIIIILIIIAILSIVGKMNPMIFQYNF
tara:strand:+ start:38 stop:169 length:132 start_codon:yes stop_codon:yes gene_type:complete